MKSNPLTSMASFASVAGFAVIAVVTGLIGCSPGSSDAKPTMTQIHVQNEAEFVKIVDDYVRRTRGWTDDSYTVQLNSRDGKMLIFWVFYKDDNLHTPGGGGKSFKAILNPDTKRVEKELHFQ